MNADHEEQGTRVGLRDPLPADTTPLDKAWQEGIIGGTEYARRRPILTRWVVHRALAQGRPPSDRDGGKAWGKLKAEYARVVGTTHPLTFEYAVKVMEEASDAPL